MQSIKSALGLLLFTNLAWGDGGYIGNYSANPYAPNSTANQFGAGGPYNPNSINNSFGQYGSPYSPNSVTNPYATEAPKLYDSQGNYHGRLSSNPYDPDSVANPPPMTDMAASFHRIPSIIPLAPVVRTVRIVRIIHSGKE